MDSHDIGRGRPEDYYGTLNSVQQPVLVLGIRSDVLYPLDEQEELHQYLGNSEFHTIESDEGHDGFLLAQEEVRLHAHSFLPPLLNLALHFGMIEPISVRLVFSHLLVACPPTCTVVFSACKTLSEARRGR